MANILTNMAIEVLEIERDLPYRIREKGRKETWKLIVDDFEVYVFEQVWGSTALGFGGMGGQAMTTANTYVFVPRFSDKAYVYFGGRFAYSADYGEVFQEDLKNHTMASVNQSGKYRTIQD